MFNEYIDILENGDVYFLDEENLYAYMLSEVLNVDSSGNFYDDGSGNSNNQQAKVPSNGLAGNGNQQQSGASEAQKTKSKSLLGWFRGQFQVFTKWGRKNTETLNNRTQQTMEQINNINQANINPDVEVEIPTDAAPNPPKLDRSKLNDPQSAEAELNRYVAERDAYMKKIEESSKRTKLLKGAATYMGVKFLFKQLRKTSFDASVNLKEGSFAIGVGTRAASQGASGNSFMGALGHVIKNVFMAILVLIGGIFKLLKIYFGAIGKIIAAIGGTVGAATKTLVTGEMPSKQQ